MKVNSISATDRPRLRTKPMMAIHFNTHTVIYPNGGRSHHIDAREAWAEYDKAKGIIV